MIDHSEFAPEEWATLRFAPFWVLAALAGRQSGFDPIEFDVFSLVVEEASEQARGRFGGELLQRVTAAVTKFGGNVLSSQVDLQGTQSKSGFLTVVASCDIDQSGLQQLLYDVETSVQFLFVDQLVVQTPSSFAAR